jgi:Uma2 family endonuclease
MLGTWAELSQRLRWIARHLKGPQMKAVIEREYELRGSVGRQARWPLDPMPVGDDLEAGARWGSQVRAGAQRDPKVPGSYTWPMGSAVPPPQSLPLPEVDERLVMPETRYEVQDGRVLYVSPADEPHGSRHSKLSALLEAYVRDAYDAATDMLTRTSATDDVAPDASVFLRERNPQTGARHVEELAFEVISTERLSHAESKARKLVGRGVRRVFAIDIERQRVLEWSEGLGSWQMLSSAGAIDDPVFAAALPIEVLVVAGKADDAMALGLMAKGNRIIDARVAEGKAEGKAEGRLEGRVSVLQEQLEEKFGALSEQVALRLQGATQEQLSRWTKRILTADSVEAVLGD